MGPYGLLRQTSRDLPSHSWPEMMPLSPLSSPQPPPSSPPPLPLSPRSHLSPNVSEPTAVDSKVTHTHIQIPSPLFFFWFHSRNFDFGIDVVSWLCVCAWLCVCVCVYLCWTVGCVQSKRRYLVCCLRKFLVTFRSVGNTLSLNVFEEEIMWATRLNS